MENYFSIHRGEPIISWFSPFRQQFALTSQSWWYRIWTT